MLPAVWLGRRSLWTGDAVQLFGLIIYSNNASHVFKTTGSQCIRLPFMCGNGGHPAFAFFFAFSTGAAACVSVYTREPGVVTDRKQ